jgi:hypothetical protein
MAALYKSIATLAQAKSKAELADAAAQAMARHCDKRIERARKALRLIDTFAWSAITADSAQSRKELQRRIDICRETLRGL